MTPERMVVCRNSAKGTHVEVAAHRLQFRPAAYGVVIHQSKILLSRFANGWILPGGGIEVGETLEQALYREIAEETGLTVTRDKFLYFEEDFVQALGEDKFFHSLRWYFLCKDPQELIRSAIEAAGV